MKITYYGLDLLNLVYGGEYEVVRALSVDGKLLGFWVIADDKSLEFVSSSMCLLHV